MGRNYYLCKGYHVKKYYECELKPVFTDLKSLESIDAFTSKFNDLNELRTYLINLGFINESEELVIGNNKTDKKTKQKRLVPIYQKKLVFKNDLERIGIVGTNYQELASSLWNYIKKHQNDKVFMSYILSEYISKYETKNDTKSKKMEAPIYRLGDIGILNRIINSEEKTGRDKSEYEFSFLNFFRNELYKCERIKMYESFDGRDSEEVTVFKPIGNSINNKGLHDMLVNVINYSKLYKLDIELNDIEETNEYEEFLEERDFERPLKQYAEKIGLNLENIDEIEKDDYATSFIIDEKRLVRKN